MKMIITESQLNELKGKFKEEVEIIYRDKNLVCLIPKSQMTSITYGKGADWCQKRLPNFDIWADQGLLVRFLFKDGRKIRFTYFFKSNMVTGYYWANETGYHILNDTKGNNPFEAKPPREGRIRDMEKDVLEKIKEIPEECKQAVLQFIRSHEEGYNYCKRDTQYAPHKFREAENIYQTLRKKYQDRINRVLKHGHHMGLTFEDNGKISIYYAFPQEIGGVRFEEFSNGKRCEERLNDILINYESKFFQ